MPRSIVLAVAVVSFLLLASQRQARAQVADVAFWTQQVYHPDPRTVAVEALHVVGRGASVTCEPVDWILLRFDDDGNYFQPPVRVSSDGCLVRLRLSRKGHYTLTANSFAGSRTLYWRVGK